MNAHDFANHLLDALVTEDEIGVPLLAAVRTYAQAGMLTRDAGLLVRTSAGDTFQVTVVQTEHGDDEEAAS